MPGGEGGGEWGDSEEGLAWGWQRVMRGETGRSRAPCRQISENFQILEQDLEQEQEQEQELV